MDIDQIPRRGRGRPRLPNRDGMPNRRSEYLAALALRNDYLAAVGWWPGRRHDFPETIARTLERVADKEIAALSLTHEFANALNRAVPDERDGVTSGRWSSGRDLVGPD